MTVLEAMATGKPIVATNVGVIQEILKSGENGILVELDDVNGLSIATCTFLQNKTLAEDVGERNVNYVKKGLIGKRMQKKLNNYTSN